MTSFTPATSLAPATVAVAGPLAVTGPLTAAQLVAAEPLSVSGPLTDAQLAARLPLSVAGPLTDAQLAARLPLSVSVGNFPATQPVSGSVNVGNFPADQLVHFTTPVTVDASGFAVPVTGPLTNAQLRAVDVGVDGSAHTQPISAAALPLPAGAATDAELAAVLAGIAAASAAGASEATLTKMRRALNDVALTALLERDKVEG